MAEERVVKIRIEDFNLEKTMDRLNKKYEKANKELSKLKEGTEQWTKKSGEIKNIEKEMDTVTKQMLGHLEPTYTQLIQLQNELEGRIKKMPKNLAATSEEAKKLKVVKEQIASIKKEALDSDRALVNVAKSRKQFWDNIKSSIVGTFAGNFALLGLQSLLGVIVGAVDKMKRLSDTQADVRKTTALTNTELKNLETNLSKIDTRSLRTDLLNLAADAGKLGIKGVKNLSEFVEGADQLKVALGEDLGENAIKDIAKLNELFKQNEIFGYKEAMLKTGSAINQVGQESTASEGYLVGYTKRLAGISKQADIALQSTIGYAAALDILGQNEELSATAMSQFVLDVFKNPSEYAKIAGKDVLEFSRILKSDANEALLLVLEGFNKNSNGLAALASKFDKLGIEGTRAIGVLATLSQNTKLVRDQQVIANKAFEKGTSLTEEFNQRNNNLAGNLVKVEKALMSTWVNSPIFKGLQTFVEWIGKLVEIPLSRKLEEERMELQRIHIRLLDVNTDNQTRVELIEELRSKYPGYLGHLNSENVTNKELSTSIKAVNDMLINKIILQKEDEKISAHNEEVANRRMDVIKHEELISNQMIKLAEKYNITLRDGLTIAQQADYIAREAAKKNKTGLQGRMFNPVVELQHQLAIYQDQVSLLNSSEKAGNAMLEAKNKLIEKLGININDAANATGNLNVQLLPREQEADNILGFKSEDIKLKVSLYSEALATVKSGSSEFIRITQKLNAANELLKTTVDPTNDELKKAQSFYDKVKKLAEDTQIELLGEGEREVAEVNLKYDRLLQEGKEFYSEGSKAFALLEQARQNELSKVRETAWKKYLEDWDKNWKSAFDKSQKDSEEFWKNFEEEEKASEQRSKLRYKLIWDNLLAEKEALVESTKGTAENYDAQRELLNAKLKFDLYQVQLTEDELASIKDRGLDAEQVLAGKKQLIYAKYYNSIKELEKVWFDEQVQNFDKFISKAESYYNQFVSIASASNQVALNESEDRYNREIEALNKKKEIGILNEDEYSSAVERIEKERVAREKPIKIEQFERNKEAAKIQAIINAAQAATKSLAEFGFPLGIIPAALAGLAAKEQIRVIDSQKVPQFYAGGYTPRSPSDFTPFPIIAHGNEYIMSADTVRHPVGAKLAEMAEAIRTGRSYKVGGYVSNPTDKASNINHVEVSKTSTLNNDIDIRLLKQIDEKLGILIEYSANGSIVVFDVEQLEKEVLKRRKAKKSNSIYGFGVGDGAIALWRLNNEL